jgi:metal-responsive CopG/Arc/MetJ family transcriptional regulator
MENIETAISLPESLFEQSEIIADEMHVSRSRLIAIALEEFICCYQTRKLQEKISRTSPDPPNLQEEGILEIMRRHQQVFKNE